MIDTEIERKLESLVGGESKWYEQSLWRREHRDDINATATLAFRILDFKKEQSLHNSHLVELFEIEVAHFFDCLTGKSFFTEEEVNRINRCIEYNS